MATKDAPATTEEIPAPPAGQEVACTANPAYPDVEPPAYTFRDSADFGPRITTKDPSLPLHNPVDYEGTRAQRIPTLPLPVRMMCADGEAPHHSLTLVLEDGSQHVVAVA